MSEKILATCYFQEWNPLKLKIQYSISQQKQIWICLEETLRRCWCWFVPTVSAKRKHNSDICGRQRDRLFYYWISKRPSSVPFYGIRNCLALSVCRLINFTVVELGDISQIRITHFRIHFFSVNYFIYTSHRFNHLLSTIFTNIYCENTNQPGLDLHMPLDHIVSSQV